MLFEPTSICRALVGLADIDVVGVIPWTVPMQVHIASTTPRPDCFSCDTEARIKQTMRRRLVDLPSFGRPVVLDDTRRRVQQQVLGHRGRKTDPLYRNSRELRRVSEDWWVCC